MSKLEFDAFVKRQQSDEGDRATLDPQDQLRKWLAYLKLLYEQIQGYLRTYVDNGAAKIAFRNMKLNEEFIGVYAVKELVLTIGRSTVTFTPIGTLLIGTKGRVDVQGPLGAARLSLIDKNITHARQLVKMRAMIVGGRPEFAPPKEVPQQPDWEWKISTPPPDMTFVELTEESFFNMILAVANG